MWKEISGKIGAGFLGILSMLVCCYLPAGSAQSLIEVDASKASTPPAASSYHVENATSPSRGVIGMNREFLTLNGDPWIPVMGEFHFSRVPESEWEEEILKTKAAGVQVVATYVIWIHHEEVENRFDWSGRRDLRHFVELCGKHQLRVIARIGPWAHGETRNGGFPDWLLTKGEIRSTDPDFMLHVSHFYSEIGAQLRGLLWKDGGPVIGVQLENEFAGRGQGQGTDYIIALKKLAIHSGMEVPLYTVTGWDNAVVPRGEVVPVFGGYPDAPWDGSTQQLPPSEVYEFRFTSRVTGSMGMMGDKSRVETAEADSSDTPFITAEMGGGIEDTYHRRPVVSADDVAAMMPVMVGSGVNLYGTYMFQGGENPDGERTTLQESQETGFPNDVPVKSYDFQAPLGEFGQEREALRKLKVFDYFLNDMGANLAPMRAHAPAVLPSSPSDVGVPRISVRSTGREGFVFVNNYIRGVAMPARKGFQVRIKLPGGPLLVPERPVDVPSGAYFIWPFNLEMGSLHLRYSTAQLFCKLKDDRQETWVFESLQDIPSEFVFEDKKEHIVSAGQARVTRRAGTIAIETKATGFADPIKFRSATGAVITIIVLSQSQAENAWRVRFAGRDRLIETKSEFFAEPDAIVLRTMGVPHAKFQVYPALDRDPTVASSDSSVRLIADGHSSYMLTAPEVHPALEVREIRAAKKVVPVRLGSKFSWRPTGVAQSPAEEMFESAGEWELGIPGDFLKHVNNVFLSVSYTGDVARLSENGRLLVDDFYNGLPWEIGLKRFASEGKIPNLTLSILPIRNDAPIYLEPKYRPTFSWESQVVDLKSVSLVPQYQFVVSLQK